MNARPSLRARQAARTRDALLRAAARHIGRRGYAGASVDGIAASAGVTKGAFYTHFSDKNEILREVLAGWMRERTRRVASAPAFRQAVAALVESARSRASAALTAELWRCSLRDPRVHGRLVRAYATWAEALERLAAADLSLQASPRDAALAALALHDGVVASVCMGRPPAGVEVSFIEALRAAGAARRTA
jgi:AcrR family transcriptional regulator